MQSDTGFYVSLLGLGYSLFQHPSDPNEHRELKQAVLHALIVAVVAPCALLYDSKFLSALTILTLESAIGFSAATGHLMVAIGFDREESIDCVIVSSWVIVVLMAVLRAAEKGTHMAALSNAMHVFGWGFKMLGVSVYFLGLLPHSGYTRCSSNSHGYKRYQRYVLSQWLMVGSLAFAFFVGNILDPDLHAVHNIAVVFTGFYLVFKYAEIDADDIMAVFKWFVFVVVLASKTTRCS